MKLVSNNTLNQLHSDHDPLMDMDFVYDLLVKKEAELKLKKLSYRDRLEKKMAAALFNGELAEGERLLGLLNRIDAVGLKVVS